MLKPISNQVYNVKYPSHYQNKCIKCGNKVNFLYPGRKRRYIDFTGPFYEKRYYYSCTNPECSLFNRAINPTLSPALPGKHYSLSVWKYIGRKAKVYNNNASKIREEIEGEYGLKIAENTIRNIIDEIDVFLSQKIDENTKRIIQDQNCMLIALDGQKPEEGSDALWLFVDVLSNRVLKVVMLKSADHITLYDQIKEIQAIYNVEIIGFVSDKQGSIVKMHDAFFSDIPHQYCQFHFLQNIWNFLEVKDSHLQKELRSKVNHLYITSASKSQTIIVPGKGKVNFREHFSKVEKKLRKIVNTKLKKFEKLRGVQTYDKLNAYVLKIDKVVSLKDESHRVSKVLMGASDAIKQSLNEYRQLYEDCIELFEYFQKIRGILNGKYGNATTHKATFENYFVSLWEKSKNQEGISKYSDLKSTMPTYLMNKNEILHQWVRLSRSYSDGLFQYYKFPIQIRTNSKMEQKFGQEKSRIIKRSGKPNDGSQIRIRGEYELKQIYAGSSEVKTIISSIECDYSKESIYCELKKLEEKRRNESVDWDNNIPEEDGLLELYEDEDLKKT